MSSTPADHETVSVSSNDSQEAIVILDNSDASTTATAPMARHKRARSSTEPEVVAIEATPSMATGSANAVPKYVLVMHLNSILDSKDAVICTIRETIAEVFTHRDVPEVTDEAILRAFSKMPILFEILDHLGIADISQEEHDCVIDAYSRVYSDTGLPRIQKASGAVEFLEEVKRRKDVALAVMSNNPEKAVMLLSQLGMGELVDTILPSTNVQAGSTGHRAYEIFWDNWKGVVEPWLTRYMGRSTTIAKRTTIDKPTITVTDVDGDNGSTTNTTPTHINPDNTGPEANNNNTTAETTNDNTATTPIKPEQVMVVSCALYDLGLAKLAGMETVWIKKISLEDEAAMQAVKTHPFVVDDLEGLHELLFVDKDVEEDGGNAQLPTVPEALDEDGDQVMQGQDQDQVQTATDEGQAMQELDQAPAAAEGQAMESQGQVQTQTPKDDQVMQSQDQIQTHEVDQVMQTQEQPQTPEADKVMQGHEQAAKDQVMQSQDLDQAQTSGEDQVMQTQEQAQNQTSEEHQIIQSRKQAQTPDKDQVMETEG